MAWCDVVEPRTLRECRIALGAPRRRDGFPLADDFRKHAVELMHEQGLEAGALAA